jgi:hypothetical protein
MVYLENMISQPWLEMMSLIWLPIIIEEIKRKQKWESKLATWRSQQALVLFQMLLNTNRFSSLLSPFFYHF